MEKYTLVAFVTNNGELKNYKTGSYLRPATYAESIESVLASKYDNGAGAIVVAVEHEADCND